MLGAQFEFLILLYVCLLTVKLLVLKIIEVHAFLRYITQSALEDVSCPFDHLRIFYIRCIIFMYENVPFPKVV